MAKLWRTLCFLLLAGLAAWPAAAWARYAAILVDAETGAVLQAVEPTTRWYPASLTKMMTVYLAFEAIEANRLDLDEQLAISMHAASQSPTELGLGAGQKIATEQAILAVILQSANDAAVVLAERIAGSEPAFAAAMTIRARELGMTRTVFRNASGLPHPEQVTTARDMAVLGRALIDDFPQHYHYFSAKAF
ncbi:MAG: D-alanyl-D-alanine carboxypeptidase family protein, partial [Dongiaceae bacterium]